MSGSAERLASRRQQLTQWELDSAEKEYGAVRELRAENESMRSALERVRDLADGWMRDAGPDSKAHVVYGPQMVSVAFAHKEILRALDVPASVGIQQTTEGQR